MKTKIANLFAALVVLSSLPALADGPKGNPAAGKDVFQKNCVLCHGLEGKGNGPAAGGLNPKPANFHDPARQAAMTEQKQVHIVTEGGVAEKLSPIMPAFGESLSPQQVRDVVAYIRETFHTEPTGTTVSQK